MESQHKQLPRTFFRGKSFLLSLCAVAAMSTGVSWSCENFFGLGFGGELAIGSIVPDPDCAIPGGCCAIVCFTCTGAYLQTCMSAQGCNETAMFTCDGGECRT